MALPKNPSAGAPEGRAPLPPRRPPVAPEQALPPRPRQVPQPQPIETALTPPQVRSSVQQRPRQQERPQTPPPAQTPPVASDTAIDPATGKRYKLLPGMSRAAVAAHKRNLSQGGSGLSLEELQKYTQLDEDFDLDDLTGTAELFLAHLRVPPSKDEQLRLREEKAARVRKQNEIYRQENEADEAD